VRGNGEKLVVYLEAELNREGQEVAIFAPWLLDAFFSQLS
jgi:hypothetical protein